VSSVSSGDLLFDMHALGRPACCDWPGCGGEIWHVDVIEDGDGGKPREYRLCFGHAKASAVWPKIDPERHLKRMAAVCDSVRMVRLVFNNESQLQRELGKHLQAKGFGFKPEVRFAVLDDEPSTDTVDFFDEESGVVIETKVRFTKMALLRQLKRYARHDTVRGFVVVAPRVVHLPAQIGKKPLMAVELWKAMV
jgi:hypothetical protein